MKEKDIQKTILDFLRVTKQFFWRNNSGSATGNYKGKQWFIRFGDKGSPDIFIVKKGKFYGIEVKSSEGKQSSEQLEWQQRFEKEGGIYLLVRSFEEFEKGYK